MNITSDNTPVGWEELVDHFLEEMLETAREAVIDYLSIDWKEKWGALDVNFFFDTDEFYNALSKVIAKYRERSKITCAVCGAAATMKDLSGWMMPLCEDCEEGMKNENA